MKVDASRFVVGDDWVYRVRDDAASERVRILAVAAKKASVRIDVAFVDDPVERVENVPAGRLRVPWNELEAYDALMANWRRIDDRSLDEVEQACAGEVFTLLIPEDTADIEWSPVCYATAVHDSVKLEEIIRLPIAEILTGVEWFDLDGTAMLSPAGTLLIAEAACRAHPTAILDLVVEQETESRQNCKHGRERQNPLTREKEQTSPEYEYYWYRRWDRPRYELLRQWCGHPAVTFHERLLAAEAENQRLDVLVADLIKALERAGEKMLAAASAEEHERDRITPWTVRPVVDRPLHPSEIPVREVRVRRRWGN